jgi:DNA-binding transcriptional LysR family regulator
LNIVLARTFLELIQARSFNKAADRLCVTQSTVTVRIAALEEELGQQLFTRDKAGVDLTVAGRKFQPFAEMLLQTWQHAKQELALHSSRSVMFSVGVAAALWEGLGDRWLLRMQREQPSVALGIESGRSAHVVEKLAQGFLDAAVVLEVMPRKDLIIEELFSEKLLLVSTYPRKAERWNPDYVYIQWSEDFAVYHRTIMPSEITPPVSFTDNAAALQFILERGGSGYFPLRQVGKLIDEGRLHIVEGAGAAQQRTYLAHAHTLVGLAWFDDAVATLREQVSHLSDAESDPRFAHL